MADNIETTLFAAAGKMRGKMDPGEYKYVALSLLFLRYVSAAYEAKYAELAADEAADATDPEEFAAENVFWVPERARWDRLAARAKAADAAAQPLHCRRYAAHRVSRSVRLRPGGNVSGRTIWSAPKTRSRIC